MQTLDDMVEDIAQRGCSEVNQILMELCSGTPPHFLADLPEQERQYIYDELKSVMDVYEIQVYSI